MMEKSATNLYEMSDPAILQELGRFIHQIRLQQNKTQQQVAASAGMNRSTIVQFESGSGGTLLSFLQILRALGQLQLLQHFEAKPLPVSPLLLAKIDQKKRQRARNSKSSQADKTQSDW